MSIRCTTKVRRGMVALTVAAGLALGVAGCGGGDGGGDDRKPESTPSTARTSGGSQPSTQEGKSEQPLAELKGPDGLLLQITGAVRDSGGFVTVNGSMKNEGGEAVNVPAQVSGNETEIIRNGSSLGGATLIDAKGKKRYYVLRDTDGRPLTTTNLPALSSGESFPVFMQFPAPPPTTTEVSFQLPMFPTATIGISG
ncbi:hypothetical protein IAG44_14210 [Streptomyces roseirectus]|uniref:Secreted protein n=1 Tax=Streptomyces roseirectus TaxID=2768066 RepID=A0A7H0ICG6_9ACTN|nr:hypothetical protein [Streptomyces roseirectus]QNP70482.1 hypothetical protein IAG44_14210 [Streptomyces roseirectus]